MSRPLTPVEYLGHTVQLGLGGRNSKVETDREAVTSPSRFRVTLQRGRRKNEHQLRRAIKGECPILNSFLGSLRSMIGLARKNQELRMRAVEPFAVSVHREE
jgi:hypothetical protein